MSPQFAIFTMDAGKNSFRGRMQPLFVVIISIIIYYFCIVLVKRKENVLPILK